MSCGRPVFVCSEWLGDGCAGGVSDSVPSRSSDATPFAIGASHCMAELMVVSVEETSIFFQVTLLLLRSDTRLTGL
jgi:hypothetical protein